MESQAPPCVGLWVMSTGRPSPSTAATAAPVRAEDTEGFPGRRGILWSCFRQGGGIKTPTPTPPCRRAPFCPQAPVIRTEYVHLGHLKGGIRCVAVFDRDAHISPSHGICFSALCYLSIWKLVVGTALRHPVFLVFHRHDWFRLKPPSIPMIALAERRPPPLFSDSSPNRGY